MLILWKLKACAGLGGDARCCGEQPWQGKQEVDASTLQLRVQRQHLVAAKPGVAVQPWLAEEVVRIVMQHSFHCDFRSQVQHLATPVNYSHWVDTTQSPA